MSCLESKYQQSGPRETQKLCIQMQLLRAVFQLDDFNLTLLVNVFAQESFREADINQRGVIDRQSFEVSWKEVRPYVDLPRPSSSLNWELKQPRRRRQQKPHKFAYLTMKNIIFARFARAFFIF